MVIGLTILELQQKSEIPNVLLETTWQNLDNHKPLIDMQTDPFYPNYVFESLENITNTIYFYLFISTLVYTTNNHIHCSNYSMHTN